jgi:hypothetical protein
MSESKLGGQFTFPGTSMTVQRIGYGAMQLAGPGVWGPPKDPDGAVAVLREAVAAGVNHIDTSDFYGPHVTNQIIRQALHPYPAGLVIVTKLGARRPPDKSWQLAISPEDLTAGVHDNLRNLGLDALDIVNYRVMGSGHGLEEGSIAEQVTVLADLRRKGLDPSHRSEQRHGRPGSRGAGDHRHCVRAEQLQRGLSPGRRPDRRLGPAGHRIRAVLPARRVHAAAVVDAVGRCGPARGHADAGRAGVAAAPVAQHPVDPRHVIGRPPPREPGRRSVDLSPQSLAELDGIAALPMEDEALIHG